MISVITTILGQYDNLRPQFESRDAEYICYSESIQADVPPWQVRPAYRPYKCDSLDSRVPKILAHLFTDSEFSIWQDGSYEMRKDPWEPVGLLGDADLGLLAHPCRSCIYQEARICLREGIGNEVEIKRMVEAYRSEGIPEYIGLYCGGVIVRRNTSAIQEFNEAWWREFRRFKTGRDQFSLAVTIHRLRPKLVVIPGEHMSNKFWQYHYHAGFVNLSDNTDFLPWRESVQRRMNDGDPSVWMKPGPMPERLRELCL